MTRTYFLGLALLALLASPAFAQPYPAQIALSWSDCPLGPYAVDMNNACTSNAGIVGTMVASFVPPGVVPQYCANSSTIDLVTSAAALSPWWHMESGGCRPTALSMSVDFVAGPFSCADFWQGQAAAGFAYDTPPNFSLAPNRARIRTAAAVPSVLAGPIDNTNMWYAYKLNISNTKTVGTGSCAGCTDGACIVLQQMNLGQLPPTPDIILNSGPQQYATYRGGAGSSAPCPAATPTRHSTWGSLKSLYR